LIFAKYPILTTPIELFSGCVDEDELAESVVVVETAVEVEMAVEVAVEVDTAVVVVVERGVVVVVETEGAESERAAYAGPAINIAIRTEIMTLVRAFTEQVVQLHVIKA
jgi:hypothetical protein